jgi:hypothetical protein
MTTPSGDDMSTIQWIADISVAIMGAVISFLIRWNFIQDAKIDRGRIEAIEAAERGDRELEEAIKQLKTDIMEPLREHREDFKRWQEKQNERWEALAIWRENMVALTPTRNQLDHKIEDVVNRLDARIRPLLPDYPPSSSRRRSPPEG